MPRRTDPGSIRVGKGRAPQGTVEDSSIRHPNRDVDPLRVHVQDPSRAHMAETIGILDAGGFYVSDEVEGALQELGAGSTGFRQNGWYEAGVADFDTAASDIGLTITLTGTWVALMGAGSVDVSGDSIVLPNNTTRWVYVDSAGVLTASAGVPNITTAENVIVGFFTTSGGAVTGKVDGRFFVRNDNRKIDFSVRSSGTAADANSEACFFSLDAALLWIDTFNTSGVSRKTHVTVRGSHILSSTVTFGTGSVVLHGEDGAEFVSGATVAPMFDLNGRSGIEFHNITFSCVHAASSAIENNGAPIANLRVEKCAFNGTWVNGVNLDAFASDTVLVSDTTITASGTGINISDPTGCSIVRTSLIGSGGVTVAGISLGDPAAPATGSGSKIEQCSFNAFDRGVTLRTFATNVSSCSFVDCGSYAVFVDEGCQGVSVTENNVDGGLLTNVGVSVTGTTTAGENTRYITVSNNKIAAVTSSGIAVVGYVSDSVISGNSIDGYAGPATNPSADGIFIEQGGGSGEIPTDVVLSNNTIRRCAKGIVVEGGADVRSSGTFTVVNNANVTDGDTIDISGVTLTARAVPALDTEFLIGASADLTAASITSTIMGLSSLYNFVAHATVSTNVVTIWATSPGVWGDSITLATSDPTGITVSGATLAGGESHNVRNIVVSDNVIHHCGIGQAGIPAPQTIVGLGGVGIVVRFAQNCTVSGNLIHDIGILLDNSEAPFFPPGADVYSYGVVVWNSSGVNCQGNNLLNISSNGGGSAQGFGLFLQDTAVEPTFTFAVENIHVENNNLETQLSGDALILGGPPYQTGIALALDDAYEDPDALVEMRSLFLNGNTIRYPFTTGISAIISGGLCSNVSIRGNKISPFNGTGVSFVNSTDDLRDFTITDNVVVQEFPSLGGDLYVSGSGIRLETSTVISNIENVSIANNTIHATESGVNIIASGEGVNVSLVGNTIRMAGSGSAPDYARPVRMNLGTLGIKGLGIRDIIFTGNVFVGGDGVRINSESGVLVENVIVSGNSFDGTSNDTDPNPLPDGFYSAFSINVEESAPSGVTDDILRNVTITGNVFQDARREAIAVTKGDTPVVRNVYDITVSNNTFNACAAAASTTHDVGAVVLISIINPSAADLCTGIRVVDNSFRECLVSNRADALYNVASIVGLNFGTSSVLGCSIAGNSFASCVVDSQQDDVCVAGGIVVFSLFALGQLDISRNTSDVFVATAISANDSAFSGFVATYSFSLNTSGVTVIGNNLLGSAVGSETGGVAAKICAAASVLLVSSADVSGAVVANNSFTASSIIGNHTGGGAEIPCEILVISNTADVVKIDGNALDAPTLLSTTGPVVAGAISVISTTGSLSNITVSNNTLRDVGGGDGIVLYSIVDEISNSKIYDNTVDGTGAAQPAAIGVAAATSVSNVSCTGNLVSSGSWVNGISYLVTGTITEAEISNNTIKSATTYGISVLSEGLTRCVANANVIPAGPATAHLSFVADDASISGLTIQGNVLTSVVALGIDVEVAGSTAARTCTGLNVSGNSVFGMAASGSAILLTGDSAVAFPVDFSGVVVSGNVIEATAGQGGSRGVRVNTGTSAGAWGFLRQAQFVGNTIDLKNVNSVAAGFSIFAQDTSGNLVFQGNTIANVNAASTSFVSTFNGGAAIDRIIVSGNTSDGAGANVSAWYGGLTLANSPAPADVALWNFT